MAFRLLWIQISPTRRWEELGRILPGSVPDREWRNGLGVSEVLSVVAVSTHELLLLRYYLGAVQDVMESPEDLIRALYPQLRDIAGRLLRRERVDHTLQRTALVHELFLRFPDGRQGDDATPGLFLARAVRQMRQILIDHARKRNSDKRGGGRARVPVVESDLAFLRDDDALLALNQALERLGRRDALALSVVELKHFAGFTNPETAAILGIPLGTVDSVWTHARLWLYRELNTPANDPIGARLRRVSVNSR